MWFRRVQCRLTEPAGLERSQIGSASWVGLQQPKNRSRSAPSCGGWMKVRVGGTTSNTKSPRIGALTST
eukprot:scaffold33333_cov67-Isochrysis_galbana.AAC.1